jgi:hypothetical protein
MKDVWGGLPSYILRGAATINVADDKSRASYRKNRLPAVTRWRLGEVDKTE